MASSWCLHGFSATKLSGLQSYGRLLPLEGGTEVTASGSVLRDAPPAQCSGRGGFTGLHIPREDFMTARGLNVDLWSFTSSTGVGRPCREYLCRTKAVLRGGISCPVWPRGGGGPVRGQRPDSPRAHVAAKYAISELVNESKKGGACVHALPSGRGGRMKDNRRSGRIFLGSSFTSGTGLGALCGRASPWSQRRKRTASPVALWDLAVNGMELANSQYVIKNLGLDTLTFLCATVVVVPIFKRLNLSPILGFLLSGVVLCQIGAFRNVYDIEALSELGILFLLFEMGLELSLARLKALAKYAFGIGLAQVLLSTLAFTAFELPTGNAIGTQLLEVLVHARNDLVNIRSFDEAVVIGAALAMSSSAFVLQILAEKGELPTRFGSATLGILLLQDIAVVPLLVLLPLLEMGNFDNADLWPMIGLASLRALGGLGLLLIGGRLLLRRLFEFVADSRSPEAFVALCLLTVTGTSLITSSLGFSDTLGAFVAGVLLAETNYRTQVEADIRPFRGLLLGLFFVTTGTSIDIQLLTKEWPNILALLFGLLAIKTSIITALGPRSGLTLGESLRTGLLLSQGGEFAFVIFSLANQLGILPLELNRLLIIVVVLSMALTPTLYELGKFAANILDSRAEAMSSSAENERVDYEIVREEEQNLKANEPLVIIGFGNTSQVLANFLETPLATGMGGDSCGWPYVAFDLNPKQVKAARKLGFPVLYGDGSRPAVLQTAGISRPKAVLVMYTGRVKAVKAVESIHQAFPGVPVFARAQDLSHLLELKAAGATDVVLETAETGLRLGSMLLQGLGMVGDDVKFLRQVMRESMEQRARELTGDEINQFLLPRQIRPFFNKPKPETAAPGESLQPKETLDELVQRELHASNGAVAGDEAPLPPPPETKNGSAWQAQEPHQALESNLETATNRGGGDDGGGAVASALRDGVDNKAAETSENGATALEAMSEEDRALVLAAQARAMRLEQARVIRLRQVAERGMVSRAEAFSATQERAAPFMAVVGEPAAENGGAREKAGVVKVKQKERETMNRESLGRRLGWVGPVEDQVPRDKRGVLLCRLDTDTEGDSDGDGSDSEWEYEGDDWGMQDPVDSVITSVARREER